MSFVDRLDAAVLPGDEEHPNLAREVRAGAHAPSVLDRLRADAATVADGTPLSNRRSLVVATAATMATDGDVHEYVARLRGEHDATDEQLVELSTTVADVVELGALVAGTMGGEVPLFDVETADESSLLGEIESTLGHVPPHYRLLANDQETLRRRWERDRVDLRGPNGVCRNYAALGAAVARQNDYAVRFHRRLLADAGESDEHVFGAVLVAAKASGRAHWRSTLGVDEWTSGGDEAPPNRTDEEERRE